jgi:uncharacterized membrane protein
MSFLRFLMLLSLVVWVGGIIFLSFVEAPTAFGALPSRHMAGTIVGRSLGVLHWMGLIAGLVFWVSSLAYSRLSTGAAHPWAASNLLICGMLLLTAVSQFGISPRMAALRTSFVDIDTVPSSDPGRLEFDALHVWSVRVEVVVLAMGLVTIFLISRP